MAKKEKTPLKMTVPDKGLGYEKARKDFLSETEKTLRETKTAQERERHQVRLPWEGPDVSERVLKSFNLRLPEPDFLKLKFVASKSSDKSMHAFCTRVVMEEVERHHKKII